MEAIPSLALQAPDGFRSAIVSSSAGINADLVGTGFTAVYDALTGQQQAAAATLTRT